MKDSVGVLDLLKLVCAIYVFAGMAEYKINSYASYLLSEKLLRQAFSAFEVALSTC